MRTNYIRALTLFAVALAAWLIVTAVWEDPAEAKKRKRGTWIVFASTMGQADDDLEIFRIKPDGTGLKQLTFNDVHDIQPALSPNGRKIAYSSPGDQAENTARDEEIYVMNSDGSGTPINLTDQGSNDTVDSDDTAPAWSPDGKKIAYTNGNFFASDIYVLNADGSGSPTLWTQNNSGVPDFRPVYSPDGSRIAFTSMGAALGDFEIYDMSASSPSSPASWRNLTNNDAQDYRPKYSSSGKKIIYDSTPPCAFPSPGGDFDVWKMNSDGTEQDNLTDDDTTDNLHPDFSPSGEKIVYMKLPAGNTTGSCTTSPNKHPGELYTRNSDGSNPKPLTNTGNVVINQSPDWGKLAR